MRSADRRSRRPTDAPAGRLLRRRRPRRRAARRGPVVPERRTASVEPVRRVGAHRGASRPSASSSLRPPAPSRRRSAPSPRSRTATQRSTSTTSSSRQPRRAHRHLRRARGGAPRSRDGAGRARSRRRPPGRRRHRRTLLVTGFVQNGDLVQVVNVVDPTPFDRRRLVAAVRTVMADLAPTPTTPGSATTEPGPAAERPSSRSALTSDSAHSSPTSDSTVIPPPVPSR